jgi:rSAM/selenodomain-associated transferase 2
MLKKTNITFIIVLIYGNKILKKFMNLDIIIPTLNEKENLLELLPFLKDHTSNTTKIYVVDSVQSSDNTSQLCQQHDITYLKSEFARRSIQMNEGAAMGKGDTILFLHADVRPPADFEKLISQEFTKGYKTGFFCYKFNPSSPLLKINEYFTKLNGIFAGGGDQCQFFRRYLFEQYGGYKEELEIMEDFEMIERLRHNKERLTIIKNPATVSARKYRDNSYLKVNLVNLISFIKYKKNVCPKEIKAYYKKSLN